MRAVASVDKAIDLTLELFDWHRRYVVARTFLRAMPCIFSVPAQTDDIDATVTSRHLLSIYRAGLLLCVATKFGPATTRIESLERLLLPGDGSRFDISISAKNAARCSVVTVQHSTERCSELCLADAMGATKKFERENANKEGFFSSSLEMLQQDSEISPDPDILSFSTPLWNTLIEFPSMDRFHSGAGIPKAHTSEEAGPNFLNSTFWHAWYYGMLDGQPTDWDLQLQVALIDDAVWSQGAEAVAREIERIRAKFNLEQEVKQLKEQLLSLQQITATPQIGDNGGPPLNDPEDIAFQTDLSQIWQRVEELENEIDSPTPSIDKLNAFAVWFQAFFIHAAKYLGAKADIIFTKGCETLGTTGTKALIAYFTVTTAAQNETIHSLPKAILDFIKSLAGG